MTVADPPPTGGATAPPPSADLAALLMLEYEQIKDEQAKRISVRDNFIYVTLVAAAAVVTGTRGFAAPVQALLLLPPVCVILGWTYLANDQKVTAIGQYVRRELGPRLSALAGAPVCAWEAEHTGDTRRRQRKWIQLGVDLTTFCLPALISIAMFLISGSHQPALITAALAEAVATLALGWQITVYAELDTTTE